jgi:hypothetical protein
MHPLHWNGNLPYILADTQKSLPELYIELVGHMLVLLDMRHGLDDLDVLREFVDAVENLVVGVGYGRWSQCQSG